jgi:hypothetical protein
MRIFTYFQPSDKKHARDVQRYWKAVKRNGIYSSGILGSLTATGVVFAPIPVVSCLAAAWAAEALADAAEHFADDPARPDYTTTTVAFRRPFHPEALGNTPLEVATGRSVALGLAAASEIDALVRASERAMGARDQDRVSEKKQIEAAGRFANRAASDLAAWSSATNELADELQRSEPFQLSDVELGAGKFFKPLDELLPAESLALSYRLGVPLRMVKERMRFVDPSQTLEELVTSVRDATEAATGLGRRLRTWTPERSEIDLREVDE